MRRHPKPEPARAGAEFRQVLVDTRVIPPVRVRHVPEDPQQIEQLFAWMRRLLEGGQS